MKPEKNIFIFIVIVLFLISILSNYLIIDYKIEKDISLIVRKELLLNEFEKVWWKENYDYIKKATISSVKQSIEYYWEDPTNINTNLSNTWTASNNNYVGSEIDYFNKIKENSYILWNKEAKITIVEFSDLECPYCAKFNKSWIIKDVIENYNWNVNYIFKHFPLNVHKQARMQSIALECYWEQLWEDWFFKFKDLIFSKTKSTWTSFDEDSISKLATTILANYDDMITCIKSWKYDSKVDSDIYDWTLAWVTWTPSSIVINNENWKYQVLPWVYEYEWIKNIIDLLLN